MNLNFRAKIDPTLLRFFDEEAYGKLDGDKSVDVKEKQSLTNFQLLYTLGKNSGKIDILNFYVKKLLDFFVIKNETYVIFLKHCKVEKRFESGTSTTKGKKKKKIVSGGI